MPECEFKEFCDSIGYTYVCQKDREEIAYCAVRITLNSPQFKKQYASRKELGKMIEKQNPRNIHSQNPSFMEGYAKMKKRALDIIRTFIPHGREE